MLIEVLKFETVFIVTSRLTTDPLTGHRQTEDRARTVVVWRLIGLGR